ncbi:MAG: NAD(P)/FAD-dependent oxidoreductase, partial [Alphaproteobacteria bacterium]
MVTDSAHMGLVAQVWLCDMRGMSESRTYDVAVVGAGMAGASVAYELARAGCKVVLLEQENSPGYHTTGRSAAMYALGYGPPPIIALTNASGPFFKETPDEFAENPLLGPDVGCLFIGRADQQGSLDETYQDLTAQLSGIEQLARAEVVRRVPVLNPEYVAGAVFEPHSATMDVNEIHMGFFRGALGGGAEFVPKAEVLAGKSQDNVWMLETPAGIFEAPLIINAAGAWADTVARRCGVAEKGLRPLRRTALTFKAPAGLDIANWPLVIDVDEEFYFKHEAGLLLGSPCDETEMRPHDAQPDEMDVAICADKIMRATTLDIPRIEHKWAGLRTFAPDGVPIVGFEPGKQGFFWLAGQGGYGIQTAPAMARVAAALVLGDTVPADIAAAGLEVAALSP